MHTTSLTAAPTRMAAGAILVVGHASREVFLFLSAFVLAYRAYRRPLPARAFWRRRLPLVLVPYIVWTAIYVVADGALSIAKHFSGFGTDIAALLISKRSHLFRL